MRHRAPTNDENDAVTLTKRNYNLQTHTRIAFDVFIAFSNLNYGAAAVATETVMTVLVRAQYAIPNTKDLLIYTQQ